MEVPSNNKEQLLDKLEEIYAEVLQLRETVSNDGESLGVIHQAAVVRAELDELEKLVFERYTRECFVSSLDDDSDELGEMLVVLHRMFK